MHRKGLPLIKWGVIQKPKELGGLGVDDIIIKNAALLFNGGGDFLWTVTPYGKGLFAQFIERNLKHF